MRVAVIPARGGSKRIPRKNIRVFAGLPMIAHSIAAARASGLFTSILVSTDDDEIAQIASAYGAEVPFKRPADLADDFTGTTAVVAHALRWLLDQGQHPEVACCIYATAPFIQPADICRGFDALLSGQWAYAFSATTYASPIQRAFRQLPEGAVEMFSPEAFETRSQDLPEALHDAAQFYWGTAEAWRKEERVFGLHSTAVVLPRWRVQDIDTEADWRRAEYLWDVIAREKDA